MVTTNASFWRDANRVPITTDGLQVSTSSTLSASNTTASVPIFRVTGDVEVKALYGIVTTALSSNITAFYWRLNDQTAQVDISLATGVTASSAAVGSIIIRRSTASGAAVVGDASAGRMRDATGANLMSFSPMILTAKNTANTDIEYTYTTTNTPASGVIQFFVRFVPLSENGNIAAI